MSEVEELVALARQAAESAHAPYSHFHVGCAVAGPDGHVAVGANMENACYRLGICAEQAALAAAQQAFGLDSITHIVIAGGPEGGGTEPVMPCGGCRQAIAEAASLAGRDIPVTCAGGEGEVRRRTTISELLPDAFDLPG
jgi:cytidine deaminase